MLSLIQRLSGTSSRTSCRSRSLATLTRCDQRCYEADEGPPQSSAIELAAPPRTTSRRDFVPWRFSAAGRRSAWLDRHHRRPKTCTGTDSCTATCDVHQKESPRPGFNPCLGLLIPPDAALTVIFESHCSGNRGTCGGDTLAAPRFRLGTEARDVLLEGALHGERTMATNILLLSTSLAMLVTGIALA